MNKNSVDSFEDVEDETQTTRKDIVLAAAKVAAYVVVPVALSLATNIVMEKIRKS